MKYTKDWQASRERFQAFWNRELIDRCCVSVTARVKPFDPPSLQNHEEVIRFFTDADLVFKLWERSLSGLYFAGDAFPNIWLNLGPSGHAGYFKGARPVFQSTSGESCTAWYEPSILDWEKDFPEFNPRSLLYSKTLELARRLAELSAGRYMISLPDIAGNLDVLAHLRGSENLLIDMLEDPDYVVRAGKPVLEAWKATVSGVYEALKPSNGCASCIGWLQVWAPGLIGQLQSDISVMISPKDFERFVMPELSAECDFLEFPVYHLDGQEQRRHLDMLLSLDKLKMIQWTSVSGQPSPVAYIPWLQKIQASGKCLYLSLTPSEVEPIMSALSSRGLMLAVSTAKAGEADDIVNLVEKLTKE